ncbi:Gal-bind_lectin domain-containing protein/Galactosyl_T domain-containing protein [Cephalotus follicularis]|uniref:Gal-bind_lectin domain-containing protein/Galactosyl_T domain-containing protein n=1 Tax=Cephalotus follicularis TaxID=3775 RepID=A0A1Q3BUM4_CEPFO|nr:Gal-bind_lectin domain-containing protein/Galactosyl_T domain-containing protein [Cephalotus follicularis]
MASIKLAPSLFRMKKWSGGMFIVVLVVILVLSYSLMQTSSKPKRESAYDFIRNHTTNDSHVKDTVSVRYPQSEENKMLKSLKKPNLIDVEGLEDLYAPINNTTDESKALLVWSQMRLLLSSSNALPETTRGIKEASVAWKYLMSTIEKWKASKLRENDSRENCLSFVSTIGKPMSSTGMILKISCGLVEYSSITLVGIPDGRNRSFEIELVGSESGRPKPPIILHYNVSLPADNMTEEPFITQNTWNNDLGWGKEERCPAHRSATNLKVDGLALCNQQVVQSTVDEKQNVTNPGSGMLANFSQGSAHASASFPFVVGIPFTATLWVGLEGFHMNVNGRHETSFAYREKLEPWSVNGVKVAGGLDLLSAIAKDLPVSEDHALIVDAERLRAPSVLRKRLVMFVGVFSTVNNFERRMAVRMSWMQYEAVRSGAVAVRFFVGLHKSSQVNFELWREAQAYGDIQLMPFVDYYSLISLKTIAICIMGTEILPAKYVMKTDDDAFVRIDEVLSSLKGKESHGLLYGLMAFESSPHREKDSKWYISEEEWPQASYPPWAHGPGYIISRDIAKFIVQGHRRRDLKLFKLEDVAMGIWIEQFKNSGKNVQYINDDRFYNAGCESNYTLAHYQGPRNLLCLWEKLQKQHQPICCE